MSSNRVERSHESPEHPARPGTARQREEGERSFVGVGPLLNLCAVAGTSRGGVVAIDEPETSLHPGLIRYVIEAFRDWAIDQDVTVLLDCFTKQLDQVYVLEPDRVVLPVKLSELKGVDWLRHFSIGDLYGHEKYGAPASRET